MTPIYFLHGKPRPGGVIRKGKKINIKHGPKPKVCLLLRPIFPPSRWCILLSPRRRDRDGTYNWRLVSCCSAFKVIRILLNGALEAIFFFTTLFCFPISTLARYCCRCKMRWAWSGVDWDGYDENPTPTKFLFFFFLCPTWISIQCTKLRKIRSHLVCNYVYSPFTTKKKQKKQKTIFTEKHPSWIIPSELPLRTFGFLILLIIPACSGYAVIIKRELPFSIYYARMALWNAAPADEMTAWMFNFQSLCAAWRK